METTVRLTGLRAGVLLLPYLALVACGGTPPPAAAPAPGAATGQLHAPLVEVVAPPDAAPRALDRPTALAVDGHGGLYVLDAGSERILHLASDGATLAQWGGDGSAPGQFRFRRPAEGAPYGRSAGDELLVGGGIAADAQGHVYVADPLNARIQKFAGDGTFLLAWGRSGSDDGQFQRPVGIAVDRHGHVYVADDQANRIQKFAGDGTFLLAWGRQGADDGEFQAPVAVVVNQHDHVYVADGVTARIQTFDRDGRFLTAWGGPGSQPGEFGGSLALAVDGPGQVYVADRYNHRVQVFDGRGTYLAEWGRFGTGAGEFVYAGGIAVDVRGDIVVADVLNGRIQQFRPRGPWPAALPGTPTPRPARLTPAPSLAPSLPVRLTPTDR